MIGAANSGGSGHKLKQGFKITTHPKDPPSWPTLWSGHEAPGLMAPR